MTAREVAAALRPFGDKPVFFASSFISAPKCTLSIYEDDNKQVWIDIASVKGDD